MGCLTTVFFTRIIEICAKVGAMANASGDLNLVAGDTGPKLRFLLKDCDGNLIIEGVSGVNFYIKKYCNGCTNTGHESVSGINVSGGVWQYCLEPGDVSAAGTYFGDLEILYDDGKVETGFSPVRILVRENNKCL